jgi:nucleoside-diphosphate-sugar epimerase
VSKILAERAAWAYAGEEGQSVELTTILPGAVIGSVLSQDNLGSVQIVQRLLYGNPKLVPRIGLWLVDVRDLADLHIRAMLAPEGAGQRFLAVGEIVWMSDIARILRDKLGSSA